jgi:hypothetical protein
MPSAPTVTDVPMVLARTGDAVGSARSRNSMRYVIAVPAASPTATPVIRRPISNPGRSFHAASTAIATIIVATAASITPRRPIRATTELSLRSMAIVPAAKIAKTTVIVSAERSSRIR